MASKPIPNLDSNLKADLELKTTNTYEKNSRT